MNTLPALTKEEKDKFNAIIDHVLTNPFQGNSLLTLRGIIASTPTKEDAVQPKDEVVGAIENLGKILDNMQSPFKTCPECGKRHVEPTMKGGTK